MSFVAEFLKSVAAEGEACIRLSAHLRLESILCAPVDVLHLDDDVLVVMKPSGLLAQPDHTGDADVLTNAKARLATRLETQDPFLGLVHRLDRPTSGLMVLARTSAAARSLSAQFRERTVSKLYVALVEGTLRGIGRWTDYIAKPGRRPTLVPPEDPDGKRAELEWQALGRTKTHTLLQVRLHTGRPHQIRLQASDRGHPVVGDQRYGATTSSKGILLHHAVLRIDHPSQPRRLTFTAAPPTAWNRHLSDGLRAAMTRMLEQAGPSLTTDSTEHQ